MAGVDPLDDLLTEHTKTDDPFDKLMGDIAPDTSAKDARQEENAAPQTDQDLLNLFASARTQLQQHEERFQKRKFAKERGDAALDPEGVLADDKELEAYRKLLDEAQGQVAQGQKAFQQAKDERDLNVLRGELDGPNPILASLANSPILAPFFQGTNMLLRGLGFPQKVLAAAAGLVGDALGAASDKLGIGADASAERAAKYDRIAKEAAGNPLRAAEMLGEDTNETAGRSVAELFTKTPAKYISPMYWAGEGLTALGKAMKDSKVEALEYLSQAFPKSSYNFNKFMGQLEFEIATDPTILVGQTGKLATLGKKLGPAVNNVAEIASRARALKELGVVGSLTREEVSAVARGERELLGILINDASRTPAELKVLQEQFDESAQLAKIDLVARPREQSYKGIEAALEGVDVDKRLLSKFREANEFAKREKVDTLFMQRLDEGGKPRGLTFREQKELGLRSGVLGEVYARLGEAGRPAAALLGKVPGIKQAGDLIRKTLISDVPAEADWLSFEYGRKIAAETSTAEAMIQGREAAERFKAALNGVPEELRGQYETLAQAVHETVAPELRNAQFVTLKGLSQKQTEQVFDLADLIGQTEQDLLRWQQAKGLPIAALNDDALYGFLGHRFSPEATKFLAENPAAREAMFGDVGDFANANGLKIDAPQFKARKIRGMGISEKDAFLRPRWAQHGFPQEAPIFDRNFARVVEGDWKNAGHAVSAKHNLDFFEREFATPLDDDIQELAEGVIAGTVNERTLRNYELAAQARRQAIEAQGAKAGFQEARPAIRRAGRDQGRITAETAFENERARGIRQEVGAVDAAKPAESPLAPARHQALATVSEIKQRLERLALDDKQFALGNINRKRVEQANKAIAEAEKALLTSEGGNLAKEVTRKLSDLRRSLNAIMPAAEAKAFDKRLADMGAQLIRLEKGQAAVAKPVAQAVNVRAAQKSRLAQDLLERAKNYKPLQGERRADFARRVLADAGIAAPPGQMSMLDVYERVGARMPTTDAELAKLATTTVNESDFKIFGDVAGLTKDALANPKTALGRFLNGFDAITRWQKRALLSRSMSLTKDVKGNALWLMVAGGPEILSDLKAANTELGGLNSYVLGTGKRTAKTDRATALGVLDTMGIVETRTPDMAKIPFGKVGKAIEEKGFIGAATQGLGSVLQVAPKRAPTLAKAGKALETKGSELAAEGTDAFLKARNYQDQVARYALWNHYLRKGFSEREAAQKVFQWLGNFKDFTKFERDWAKRLWLFYSWQKKMLPAAFRAMLERPFMAKQMLALSLGNVQGEDVDQWLKRQGGWIIGRGENGQADVVSIGSGTPFSVLNDLSQSELIHEMRQGMQTGSFSKAFVGLLHGALDTLARKAPPLASGAYELATGKESFTGFDITGRATGAQANKLPAALGWLRNVPGMTKAFGLDAEMDKRPGHGDEVLFYKVDPSARAILDIIMPSFLATAGDISRGADPRKPLASNVLGGVSANVLGTPSYRVEIGKRGTLGELRQKQMTLKDQALGMDYSPFKATESGALYINENSSRYRDLFPQGKPERVSEQLAILKAKAQNDGYARQVYRTLLWSVAMQRTYKAISEGKDPTAVSLDDLGLGSLATKRARLDKLELKTR